MTSVVAICNRALANIAKQRIDALDEGTAEARACRLFYEPVRDAVLQSYPWRCAGKTVALAEVASPPSSPWLHAYQRPFDCLRVRWIRPNYSTSDRCVLTLQQEVSIPYDVDGDLIFCNLPVAFLRYTSRLADVTSLSPLLAEAIEWHLAARLAMPLTKDPKIRADALQLARDIQSKAEVADANETHETSDHDSEMIEARG